MDPMVIWPLFIDVNLFDTQSTWAISDDTGLHGPSPWVTRRWGWMSHGSKKQPKTIVQSDSPTRHWKMAYLVTLFFFFFVVLFHIPSNCTLCSSPLSTGTSTIVSHTAYNTSLHLIKPTMMSKFNNEGFFILHVQPESSNTPLPSVTRDTLLETS